MQDLQTEIHSIFNVKEPHELPSAMMETLLDPIRKEQAFARYKAIFPDLNRDVLRDYFQECQAQRSTLKQDYTPESICRILAEIAGTQDTIADLCAGTGSLTLEAWKKSPEAIFYCYELSSASIPFLLFNLALRKISAFVIHGDLLTEEVKTVYRIENGHIEKIEGVPSIQVDAVISNPPYSLKWSGAHDLRFGNYSTPPKKAADYAFVLIGLNMLKPDGIALFILPHGTLFRANTEGEIRKQLVEDRRLDAVIGLPDKLFANTQIPVQIMIFRHDCPNLLVIDASKEMKKQAKQNLMMPEHIETVLSSYRMRRNIDRLASVVSYDSLKDNDWNLNIPRYVDSSEPVIFEPPEDILLRLIDTEREIKRNESKLAQSIEQMVTTNPNMAESWKLTQERFREWASI